MGGTASGRGAAHNEKPLPRDYSENQYSGGRAKNPRHTNFPVFRPTKGPRWEAISDRQRMSSRAGDFRRATQK